MPSHSAHLSHAKFDSLFWILWPISLDAGGCETKAYCWDQMGSEALLEHGTLA